MLQRSALWIVGVVLFVLVGARPVAAQAADARPNIVLCIADDWGYPHAGAYGYKAAKTPTPQFKPNSIKSGGLWFVPPPAAKREGGSPASRPTRVKHKNDPKLVAMSREFRERFLEELNANELLIEGK